ncbi:hypothetical protein T492DRAFT_840874 [Pavlovales sp. CCMP2436]|nr:hypothetical protein T492DRAFT_840874 [Pavlovales sp. CCMP2436]
MRLSPVRQPFANTDMNGKESNEAYMQTRYNRVTHEDGSALTTREKQEIFTFFVLKDYPLCILGYNVEWATQLLYEYMNNPTDGYKHWRRAFRGPLHPGNRILGLMVYRWPAASKLKFTPPGYRGPQDKKFSLYGVRGRTTVRQKRVTVRKRPLSVRSERCGSNGPGAGEWVGHRRTRFELNQLHPKSGRLIISKF